MFHQAHESSPHAHLSLSLSHHSARFGYQCPNIQPLKASAITQDTRHHPPMHDAAIDLFLCPRLEPQLVQLVGVVGRGDAESDEKVEEERSIEKRCTVAAERKQRPQQKRVPSVFPDACSSVRDVRAATVTYGSPITQSSLSLGCWDRCSTEPS